MARSIGVPLQEARALEGIGRSYLQDKDSTRAAPHLREAAAIHQRIGVPAAAAASRPGGAQTGKRSGAASLYVTGDS